jgi:hypothetical protein
MSTVNEPVTPMRRVTTVLATFVLGAAAAAALWNWWSPRCGDDCPTRNVVHMLVFLGLLPTLGTAAAVLLVSTSWPKSVKLGIAGALLLAALIVGGLLARIPAA